tara:strand:- start:209 stop:502 length:294 start_codon:yes stop_codon:yes gene_type:complete
MVARRKPARRRAKKSFNVSAIELGTALSLSQSTGAANAVQTALSGNLSGAIDGLSKSVMSNKNRIVATLGSAFIAKALTKGFSSGTLAKLGPIRIKA